MQNFNGELIPDSQILNRGFLFADAVFETIRVRNEKILFLEDHYFRLMSAMRILRMEIPMEFTMEFLEEQWLATAKANQIEESGRIRMTVFRSGSGLYLPETREVSYIITASGLPEKNYTIPDVAYEVELYKDFHLAKHLLTSVKTTAKTIHVTGSIFASENGYDNCLLINEQKNVVEALNANIFLVNGNKITTPPVSEGCINGVMRKQILALAKTSGNWEVAEEVISPFDLQKSDEIFLTNVISGIQPVRRYRKKDFTDAVSRELLQLLNESLDKA